jgi:hypothetical protein
MQRFDIIEPQGLLWVEDKWNEIPQHVTGWSNQIKSLRAEIGELHDEKWNAMDDMKQDLELAALKCQYIWVVKDMNINLEHQYIWVDEDININLKHILCCQQWGMLYGQ